MTASDVMHVWLAAGVAWWTYHLLAARHRRHRP